jgi:hypothetical protein
LPPLREGAHRRDRRRVYADKHADDVEREIAAVARDDGSGEVNAVRDGDPAQIVGGRDAAPTGLVPKENERVLKLPYTIYPIINANAANTGLFGDDGKLMNEIIEWMATEVKRHEVLNHHKAAKTILERLGVEALWRGVIVLAQEHDDCNGSIREVYRFSPAVLEAFRQLTGKTVRWGKWNRNWYAKPKQRRTA